MGDTVRIRFPTLEIYAHRSGGALSVAGRSLTSREITLARGVFQDSIDLTVVHIVRSRIAAAPTTLGNNIRTQGPMSDNVLVHELTHVWQYQNMGTRYISDSLCHQVGAMISGGSRNGAYNPTVVPNRSFSDYPAEHQAVIVERWFGVPAYHNNPDYQALIDEVRRARPLAHEVRRQLILEEAAFGAGMGHQRTLPPSPREFFLQGPAAPLIRFEF